ncbi:hypothetical protein TRFO_07235 [Tritrichomonas foetus]|uniref:Uncharacterized protein n=1 Tax=Tritrichomonas foetus TaxID=1144522 RepID=A0A1J4JTJ5_9EUKA|nr:hypothetical protein [Tritrichomonas foetus]OHT02066.1 hypothetical protein TRFO_07235 [Tritrichomonas foetus]|eukprot:OHT02066.1 hypothetical protein TRFO_07235 [Tritrichomonas foetus]
MNLSHSAENTMTRTGYTSPVRTLNISTPETPETHAMNQAQGLRTILQEKMVEFNKIKSNSTIADSEYTTKIEAYVAQLRDLDHNFQATKTEEATRHALELKKLQEDHKEKVLFLENQLNEGLSGSDTEDDLPEYDNEIAALKAEIAKWDDQPTPTGVDDLIGDDAEERIRELEERYEEMLQLHEEALQQREDDSKDTTSKIEQMIVRGQEEEASLNQEIQELVDRLTQLDSDQAARIDEYNREMADQRTQITNSLRNVNAKISHIQKNISKKQRTYSHQVQELHDQADTLRSELESYTTRQKQQMKEAAAAAKAYAEVRRKFVSMHKELEMLNSEKVREIVEHETLMKGLNKMDNFVLSQMSASAASIGSGSRTASTRQTTSRGSSLFSSRGSKF